MTDFNLVEKQAGDDAVKMLDLSRSGEKCAELMLEDVFSGISDRLNQSAKDGGKNAEELVNHYINTVNSKADEAAAKAGHAYNLNFKIVDENKDGKWNAGEKIQVHNESRYWFRQPAPFNLDGVPDSKDGPDAMLKNQSQLDKELD